MEGRQITNEKGVGVREYSFINLFRAIAALWVLAAHCMIWGGWYGIPLPSPKLAVDLFMMISGYLMAANACNRDSFEPLSTTRNWCRFLLRRIFRLAPAYYLSLAVAAALSSSFLMGYHHLQQLNPDLWSHSDIYNPLRIQFTLENLLWHLSFLFGLHPTHSFSTFLPDWSLSLEMQFYVIFPALMLIMRKKGFIRCALAIGAFSVATTLVIDRVVQFYEPSLLLFKLQYFIAGILLFQLLRVRECNREWFLSLASALMLVSLEFKYGKDMLYLPLLLLSMCFLAWLEHNEEMPAWLVSLMNCRVVRFASDCSYSVYLFHGFFLSACGLIIAKHPELLALSPPQRVGLIFLFVLTLTYAAAYLAFRLVEIPGIRIGKYFIQQILPLEPTPVPSPEERQGDGEVVANGAAMHDGAVKAAL